MNLEDAVSAHASWKVKFRTAIEKRARLDADSICKDNNCELGKWLHGPGKSSVGQLPEYSKCVNEHANFHVQAGQVATAINKERYSEAANMLAGGTPYDKSSSAVAAALIRLKKAAKL